MLGISKSFLARAEFDDRTSAETMATHKGPFSFFAARVRTSVRFCKGVRKREEKRQRKTWIGRGRHRIGGIKSQNPFQARLRFQKLHFSRTDLSERQKKETVISHLLSFLQRGAKSKDGM